MSSRENSKASAKAIALGGILAALAMVIMCLGGLIPFATFVCPMLCILLMQTVKTFCGSRIGWAWYAAVAILSMLMGPDKEGAALLLFLGYYPLIKSKLEKLLLPWLWKFLFFNAAILMMYTMLIYLFGMAQLAAEYEEMGAIFLIPTILLGNLTFFLLDKLLSKRWRRKIRNR